MPAMLSQSGRCERSELAANDSAGGRCRGSRMGGVSDGLHSTFSQRPVFISIPASASVLFSSAFQLQPASCFHQHSTFSQRPVFISIPASASVLFSSAFHLQPASCFHLHFTLVQRPVSSVLKKIKKGVDRTGKVV